MLANAPVLASGSADTTVKIWDMRSLSSKPVQTLDDAGDTVSTVHAHMPTTSIISGSYDGKIRSYDLRMGTLKVDVMGHSVGSVRCSADGNTVLASCLDGRIRLVDREGGGVLKAFGGEKSDGATTAPSTTPAYRNKTLRIRSTFAKGDSVVVSGSEPDEEERPEASIFAWDVLSGDVIGTVLAADNVKVVSCVAWNEKGKTYAGGCSDGELLSACTNYESERILLLWLMEVMILLIWFTHI